MQLKALFDIAMLIALLIGICDEQRWVNMFGEWQVHGTLMLMLFYLICAYYMVGFNDGQHPIQD